MICTLPGHTGGAMLDWLCGRRTSMQGIPWQFVTHPMIFRANTDLFWSLQSHNFLPIFHDLFHLIHILLSGLLIINSNWFIPIYKKGVLKIVKPRFRHLFRHKKPSGRETHGTRNLHHFATRRSSSFWFFRWSYISHCIFMFHEIRRNPL